MAVASMTLPIWFLEENVFTPGQLEQEGTVLSIVESDTTTQKERHPEDAQTEEDAFKPNVEVVVSHRFYEEAYETLASTFVHDAHNSMPANESVMLLICKMNRGMDILDAFVRCLARDLGASLITLDLEDLIDLAWDFDRQVTTASREWNFEMVEEAWTPKSLTASGPASHYFAARSQCNASATDWNRNMMALDTILIGSTSKSRNLTGENVNTTNNSGLGQVPNASISTLLHLRDINRIMELDEGDDSLFYERGGRIAARLRDWVKWKRGLGESLTVITSLSHTGTPDDNCYCWVCCGEYMDPDWDRKMRKLGIEDNGAQVIYLTPPDIELRKTAKSPGLRNCIADINIRQIKRLLRSKLSHCFPNELLLRHTDWTQGLHEGLESMGKLIWPQKDVQRVGDRLKVRSSKKNNQLNLEDVQAVFERLDLFDRVQTGGLESTTVGSTSEEWATRLSEISKTCNEHERELLEGVVQPKDLQSKFEDVIIDEEVKKTIRFLISISRFQAETTSNFLLSQIQIKGALLYGPPGTGKTHFSRAIAKESNSSMLCIDGALITSMWVGETEKYIKAAFTLAAKLAPCVLFIDEADSLFRRRTSNDKSWERSSVTQFLTMMDGLKQSPSSPFVLVATNRPMDLDEAFLRRLPQKVMIGLPTLESRFKILGTFLKEGELAPDVNVRRIAELTDGYSGSDLRSVCAEAALLWAMDHVAVENEKTFEGAVKMRLEKSHFDRALENIYPTVSKQSLYDLEAFDRQYRQRHTRLSLESPHKLEQKADGAAEFDHTREDEFYTSKEDEATFHGEDLSSSKILIEEPKENVDPVEEISSQPASSSSSISASITGRDGSVPEPWALIYKYLPLDESKKEIRLIEFHFDGEKYGKREFDIEEEAAKPFSLRMVKASLLDSPKFRALSYVWGPSERGRSLILRVSKKSGHWTASGLPLDDGEEEVESKVNVTDNLLSALIHCRTMTSQDRPAFLWIDALCINQRDNEEKSWQVAMMADVYTSAFMVHAWLGQLPKPLTFSVQQFLATIEKLVRKGRQEFGVEVELPLGIMLTSDGFHYSQKDLVEWVTKSVRLVDSPFSGENDDSTYSISSIALKAFLSLAYWRRVWIFQEVLLARQILVSWGTWSINLRGLFTAIRIISKSIVLSVGKPGSSKLIHSAEGDEIVPKGYVGNNENMLLSMLDWKYDEAQFDYGKRLWQLVIWNVHNGGLEATGPVDYIFGFFGAMEDRDSFGVKVDYSASCEAIYTEAAKSWISTEGPGVLTYSQWPKRFINLPSWAPDWSCLSPESCLFNISEQYRVSRLNTMYTTPRRGCRFEDTAEGPALVVGANIITSVKSLLPIMLARNRNEKLIRKIWDLQAKLQAIKKTVEQLATAYWTEEDRHAALASVLVAGGDDLDGRSQFLPGISPYSKMLSAYKRLLDPSTQRGSFNNWWDRRLSRASLRLLCVRTFVEIANILDPSVHFPFQDVDGYSVEQLKESPGIYCQIALQDYVDQGLNYWSQVDKEYFELRENITAFFNRLECVNQGRRPFLCADGYLGLGPYELKSDDVVVHLDGSQAPFVLRPLPSGRFKLVGEAYVHGLMERGSLSAPIEDFMKSTGCWQPSQEAARTIHHCPQVDYREITIV